MSRTLNDMPTAGRAFPSKGWHSCVILSVLKGRSQKKKTPQIELTISNGETEFTDQIYVTEKTISRLALVAKHVAGMPGDYNLPDDNAECANVIAGYIAANITGKRCLVEIEETEEDYVPESGPNMGRKMTRKRRRVSFAGYKRIDEQKQVNENTSTENDFNLPEDNSSSNQSDGDLPF
jgi:hypothetical protein